MLPELLSADIRAKLETLDAPESEIEIVTSGDDHAELIE